MNTLTVAYITNRKEPRHSWFRDSLLPQISALEIDVEIRAISPFFDTPPKPCVWSGPHRLTSRDYFSAANARNTAAALCETDWIAFVDDLSVLGPEWLTAVRDAMAGDYIVIGTYEKVRKLVFENGKAVSFESFPAGRDTRLDVIGQMFPGKTNPYPCDGAWMYGCSVAMPLEALLTINGFPEILCDSLGGEDYMTGIALQNAGYRCKIDLRMLTLESEEDHAIETPAIRWDPGISPNDKSHMALDIATKSKRFENDFGEGFSLRELRDCVLKTGEFPIRLTPDREWFTGKPLKEL